MAYQFEPGEPIEVGLRRIASEQIDSAAAATGGDDPHEAVHEVRKACKKLRGLLRLVRPTAPDLYERENAYFRDLARELSDLRDAEAAIETYDALMQRFGGRVDRAEMGPIRGALTRHRQALAEEIGDLDARLRAAREGLEAAHERLPRWRLASSEAAGERVELFADGLKKTYRRGRKAMAAAYAHPGVDAFHEWRKRAKYLRYHLRLLRPAWPAALKRARSEVKTLGDRLGDEHDLAVLRETLPLALGADADPTRTQVFSALIAPRCAELRSEARWLGLRVYAETPKAFTRRLAAYWEAARQEDEAARGRRDLDPPWQRSCAEDA